MFVFQTVMPTEDMTRLVHMAAPTFQSHLQSYTFICPRGSRRVNGVRPQDYRILVGKDIVDYCLPYAMAGHQQDCGGVNCPYNNSAPNHNGLYDDCCFCKEMYYSRFVCNSEGLVCVFRQYVYAHLFDEGLDGQRHGATKPRGYPGGKRSRHHYSVVKALNRARVGLNRPLYHNSHQFMCVPYYCNMKTMYRDDDDWLCCRMRKRCDADALEEVQKNLFNCYFTYETNNFTNADIETTNTM